MKAPTRKTLPEKCEALLAVINNRRLQGWANVPALRLYRTCTRVVLKLEGGATVYSGSWTQMHAYLQGYRFALMESGATALFKAVQKRNNETDETETDT